MVNYARTILKLKNRFGNISYKEVKSLLLYLGYEEKNKGKTSGARTVFRKKGKNSIYLHKPYSRKNILKYQIDDILDGLKGEI